MKNAILYIEPEEPATEPIIDNLTRQITTAFRERRKIEPHYLGYHTCVCGAESTSCDYLISIGGCDFQINSLAVHYIACHRNECPEIDMRIVKMISMVFYSRIQPSADELRPKYGSLK